VAIPSSSVPLRLALAALALARYQQPGLTPGYSPAPVPQKYHAYGDFVLTRRAAGFAGDQQP
jgi:hypothetical protein